ncbi:MAG: ATP-binding cassette domain-containing protein [Rhodothermales bacterium]
MIRVENLHKSLGGKRIIHDVNLEIHDAEIFAIIGRSGSGKTVLMKHLIGLHTPDEGRVLIDGDDLFSASHQELQKMRRRFGVLFQRGAILDYMSVFENTAFPLRMLTDRSESEIARRVYECLEMVELPDASGKMPAQLSGGELKRVALARAIVLEPEYLFYDEPNTGLDPETANTIDDLIVRTARTLSITSVVVTHNMHTVLTISDRVGFLHDGTMRFIGTVREMRTCPDEELRGFIKANEYKIEGEP